MSSVGWYPDPGGKPGRYRYWDGESWSDALTDDPADPPPGAGTGRRPPRDAEQQRGGRSFLVAVLVLVLVVVSAVLIVRRTADAGSALGSVPPTTTASPWNDASPLGQSPSQTPSSASPTDPSSSRVNCPTGRPDELSLHPQDGRVHGGRLSMAPVRGYSDPEPEYMLSWMWDTQGVDQVTEPGWQSIFAVGEIHRTDGFSTLRSAAQSSLSCALRNGWYLHLRSSKTIRDESISIDGHDGWIVTAEVRDNSRSISVAGDQLTFVVVDDGRSDVFSVWCGMVPLGDQERLALDQRVLSGLKVRG